jgi:two-component system cell cycle response regulator DivK
VPHLSVLVVDPSEETREVLRTAFARRGTKILEASQAEHGLDLARRHQPTVIVLDADLKATWPASLADGYDEQSQRNHSPLVLLGTVRRQRGLPAGEFVSKPYHYAPLIRKIEQLLEQAQQPLVRSA